MRDYSILDDLDVGIQIVDSDMRYVYLNEQLLATIGLRAEEIVGRSMVQCFPGIENTAIYSEIWQCLQTHESRRVTNEFTFPDGRVSWHELHLMWTADGVFILSRDITETKRGETLLRESNEQLEQFAHIAAHDMRAPLRRILVFARELLDYDEVDLPADVLALGQLIEQQAASLMTILDDMRALSGIGSAERLQRAKISMLRVVTRIRDELATRLSEHAFEVDLPTTDVEMEASESLVELIWRNLFENALLHGHSRIEVAFDARGEGGRFGMSNPTENPPPTGNMLLPFISRKRSGSTGLGLAIVKKAVDWHDGTITATHHDDRFTVRFSLERERPSVAAP